jgi:hypothetical protein
MCIPDDVQVNPLNDICSKWLCKRILGHETKTKKKKNGAPQKYTTCKDVGHGRHNCPNKYFSAI